MVFRVVTLSIVLTVAGGQNAALLCKAWCDSHTAPASAPHHEHAVPASASAPHHDEQSSNHSSTSLTVAGNECCDNMVVSAAAVVREDVRRDGSSPGTSYAIPVPRYQFTHPTINTRPGQEPGREWSLRHRPLSSALRI